MSEKKYFKKSILSTPLRLSNGSTLPWIHIGYNDGALETDNETVISELTQYAKEVRGGIQIITAEQFEDLKKNSGKNTPPPKPAWQPTVSQDLSKLQVISPKSTAASVADPVVVDKPKVVKVAKPVVTKGVVPA